MKREEKLKEMILRLVEDSETAPYTNKELCQEARQLVQDYCYPETWDIVRPFGILLHIEYILKLRDFDDERVYWTTKDILHYLGDELMKEDMLR